MQPTWPKWWSMNQASAQEQVRAHWDRQPCDSETSRQAPLSRAFFTEIEAKRYALQPHILECLGWVDWAGKRVLEIGAGLGTDARRLIAAGAHYTGINVDRGSTDAATAALRVFGLPGETRQCDATALEFPDQSFDAVYSFGVLQHIPDVARAVAQIERVLKPGGQLLMMVYNRVSINYLVEIQLLRKLGVRLLGIPGAIPLFGWFGLPTDKLARHQELRAQRGPMSEEEWLSRNTNGPDYPYCTVYDVAGAEQLLRNFDILRHETRFFDHRHWGVLGSALPPPLRRALGSRWGWHRMVLAQKRGAPSANGGQP
jgi:SAM-dependent methyltransferase